MAKHFLKLSETDWAVKIYGPATTVETINLATDLICMHSDGITPREEVTEGSVPRVVITGMTWTGELGATLNIDRGTTRIASLQSQTTTQYDFGGQGMVPDNVEDTKDIKCKVGATGHFELWLRLRKISGYSSRIEYHAFGAYDNPNKVGE